MQTINIHEAKIHLSQKRLGFLRGTMQVPADFDRMGDDAMAGLFAGGRVLKFLIDTHLLIWAANEPEKLVGKAVFLLTNPEHELLFSAASFGRSPLKMAWAAMISKWMHGYSGVACWITTTPSWLLPVRMPSFWKACR